MSAILDRLRAVFDTHPLIVSDLPVHAAGPTDLTERLAEVADTLAALANSIEGGVIVLGLEAKRPHRARGVSDVEAWARAVEELADALVPPVPIDIEAGEEDGHTVLAAYVPLVPVVRGHVHRQDAPPCRIIDGVVEPWFPPLREPPEPVSRSGMLAAVEGSTPLWVDPVAAGILGHAHPGTWERTARSALRDAGLLAGDGVRLTRAGTLLLALPEFRPAGATVVVEDGGDVAELTQSWLMLARSLRQQARAAGHAHAALVADLVLDVLVRTAGPVPRHPLVVDLSRELVTIEAPRPPHGDGTLPRLLERFTPWRRDDWRALVQRRGLAVTEERQGGGLFLQLRTPHVVAMTPRVVQPARKELNARAPGPVAEAIAYVALPTRESEVLSLLGDGRSWTRRELDARLGWSRSTLRRALEGLVRDGRVLTDAVSPRSPHQAYRAA